MKAQSRVGFSLLYEKREANRNPASQFDTIPFLPSHKRKSAETLIWRGVALGTDVRAVSTWNQNESRG
jgi:hypothetical protein